MILKRLVLVAGVIVMLTGIIIFVQGNNPVVMKDVKTFENYENIVNIEELGLEIVADCWQKSHDLSESKICFNEKINLLESKFPSIRTDLKKMGFVLEDYSSSKVMKFSNVSDNQQQRVKQFNSKK